MTEKPTLEQVQALHQSLKRQAEAGGYHLNPDTEFVKDLVRGLLVNEMRYGYPSCPCRFASGRKEQDLDIICPCDYRDPDLSEYGSCYCALYVSAAVLEGNSVLKSIPERRPPGGPKKVLPTAVDGLPRALPYPVWRCNVCGYLCARNEPPEVCPVCKAKKDRFRRFM